MLNISQTATDTAIVTIHSFIHSFINTHKAAVIIKYKNTQSTMNIKIYKRKWKKI